MNSEHNRFVLADTVDFSARNGRYIMNCFTHFSTVNGVDVRIHFVYVHQIIKFKKIFLLK